jgi:uncharacterized DUF497 family protein
LGEQLIEFDHVKREMTLFTRGLDMARSSEVFASPHMNQLDDRKNYGETRIITFGYLDHLPIVLVWTYRGNTKRIISLRKANEREIKKNVERFG